MGQLAAHRRIHLIGVGGAGLSAIATVLLEQGYSISGSDLQASPITKRLERLGATVHIGHAAGNLGNAELVVVSSAVPNSNPEVIEAHRRGTPVVKRAKWLGQMMANKRGVAVAGTHGKTTTTAMISLILRDAGLDPTFIVGGDISQLGTGAAAGKGDLFIIEADEYDHTFLGLRPEIAVITAVEWDHPDCYPTPQSMQRAFWQFVVSLPPQGLMVACQDEPSVQDLLKRWRSEAPPAWDSGQEPRDSQPFPEKDLTGNLPLLITYGLNAGNEWRAHDLVPNGRGGYDFTVYVAGTLHLASTAHVADPKEPRGKLIGNVSLAVPGTHNVKNALAALVVADHLGVDFSKAAATLASFTGVGRRFEIKGEARGILVVDDYAHHPTEIRATLAAARTRFPGRSIWAVFQPHTYSRTRMLLGDFAAAFANADHVILVDIFPAREMDDGSITSRDILARMQHPNAHYVGALDAAAEFVADRLRPGDVLITLGAGDGFRVGESVIKWARNGR